MCQIGAGALISGVQRSMGLLRDSRRPRGHDRPTILSGPRFLGPAKPRNLSEKIFVSRQQKLASKRTDVQQN